MVSPLPRVPEELDSAIIFLPVRREQVLKAKLRAQVLLDRLRFSGMQV
jgi:hypothetical protein